MMYLLRVGEEIWIGGLGWIQAWIQGWGGRLEWVVGRLLCRLQIRLGLAGFEGHA